MMSSFSKSTIRFAACAAMVMSIAGCLQTRESQREVEEKQVLRRQMSTLQQTNADSTSRFQGLEDDIRTANGRFDNVDNQLKLIANKADSADAAINKRITDSDVIYREELTKLGTQINELKTQLAALQEDSRRSAEIRAEQESKAKADQEAASKKTPLQVADEKFDAKNWKDAILDYEKYRSANPKGKQFATATYKIGFAFQELGMETEAGAFYDEVIAKFPKSKEAGKASARLKSLKKKK